MDAVFSIFLETFGDPIGQQPVPPAAIDHYQGKLPYEWGDEEEE